MHSVYNNDFGKQGSWVANNSLFTPKRFRKGKIFWHDTDKLVTNWFIDDSLKRGFYLHSAVEKTTKNPWWMTLLSVMVIIKTNFHFELFVSLVKRKVKKLYLPSQPRFVITVLLGASALSVLEKDAVLWTRPRKPCITLSFVIMIWAIMANKTSVFHLITYLIWFQYLKKMQNKPPFLNKEDSRQKTTVLHKVKQRRNWRTNQNLKSRCTLGLILLVPFIKSNLGRGGRAFEKLQRKAAIIIKSCL